MKEIIFNVEGMHCKSCEMLIEDSMKEIEGVEDVKVSHEKRTVKVTFDETKVKEDQIKAVIKKEGYEVE